MKRFTNIQAKLIFSFFLLPALCILTSSCNVTDYFAKKLHISNSVKSDDNVIESELKRNRELWANNNTHDYRMVVECSRDSAMGIDMPVDIEISNGIILNIEWSAKNKNEKLTQEQKEIVQRQYENYASSVGKLFNFIDLKNNEIKKSIRLAGRADGLLTVSYNSQIGYPEQIKYQSFGIHGSMLFKVKNFEISTSKNS